MKKFEFSGEEPGRYICYEIYLSDGRITNVTKKILSGTCVDLKMDYKDMDTVFKDIFRFCINSQMEKYKELISELDKTEIEKFFEKKELIVPKLI